MMMWTRRQVLDRIERETGHRYGRHTFSNWENKKLIRHCEIGANSYNNTPEFLYSGDDVDRFIDSYFILPDDSMPITQANDYMNQEIGRCVGNATICELIIELRIPLLVLIRPTNGMQRFIHTDDVERILTCLKRRYKMREHVSDEMRHKVLTQCGMKLSEISVMYDMDLGLLSNLRSGNRPMTVRTYLKLGGE